MCCMVCGSYDAAATLIAAGARLDLRNHRGKTAADLALENSAPDFVIEALQGRPQAMSGQAGKDIQSAQI